VSTPSHAFRRHPAHAAIGLPVRLIVGAVFIYASLYKLAEPHDFAVSIALYDMLPTGLINPMAIALPAVELAVGLTLILGLWTRASAAVINAMLVVFIAAIGYVVFVRGMADFGCGCFSPAAEEASGEMATDTLFRDVGYLVGAVYVMIFDDGALGADGLLRKRRAGRGTNEISD